MNTNDDPSGLGWSVKVALSYLKATVIGRSQLQFLKDNARTIRVSKTEYLRWEAWKENEPSETWISRAYGVTFPTGKYKANVCDVCIASDNLCDPIDAAATIVHELEHAKEKITGAGITEGHARVAEMTFYLQLGEVGMAKLMHYYGKNIVNVNAVLEDFNQATIDDPLRGPIEYGPAQFGNWVDITQDLLE
jgi:hypothetical protein